MGALLTVAGDLVEDVVVWVHGDVRRGTDNASSVRRVRGGSAANVAAAAAAAGTSTRFVGRVGDDQLGAQLVQSLVSAGVDVRVQRAGRTGSVVVLVDPTGERTMFPDRAASAELAPVAVDWLVGTTLLHVPAYGLTVEPAASSIEAAVRAAHAMGADVSIDVSAASLVAELGAAQFHSLLDELRPRILFANAAEADALGLEDRRPVVGRTAVIKDGARPARVLHPDGRVDSIPPTPLEHPVDTTGAGDAFAGGFLASWLQVPDAAAAARAGHDLAARVLSSPGASLSPDGGRGGMAR